MRNKKSVAIVTIYSEVNYGNRLQNYAVQKCLEKWGYKAESIVCVKPYSVLTKTKNFVKTALTIVLSGVIKNKRPDYLKNRNFCNFTKRYIPTRYIETTDKTFSSDVGSQYDIFVIGSDQVWNPCFGDFEDLYENMFLMFAPDEKKRCFSPSFGVTEIPDEWRQRFKEGLATFPSINVREESGINIVKEMTGKDAASTIDPTLMLDASEWIKVAKPVKGLPDEYVLDYFLGETPSENSEYMSVQKHGEKRIKLLDKSNPDIYVSGPSEFIYLISRANVVCTDSFHACVFSILFGKPFMVFKRNDGNNNMLTRIETLLSLFDIELKENLEKKIIISKEKVDEVLKKGRSELETYFK